MGEGGEVSGGRSPAPGRALHVPAGLLLAALLCSCGIHPGQPSPDDAGEVITGDRLRATQAANVLDALELAGTFLHIHQGSDGVHIGLRGPGTLLLSSDCLVILDAAPLTSASLLASVPTQSVKRIRILQAHEATLRYGTNGGNGVLEVETTARTAASSD